MWPTAEEKVALKANARAEKIRRQIVRMAAKQGAKDVYLSAKAHLGSGYYSKPTGAVALTFTTIVRQRTVNDLKKPFDLPEIVRLLVEKHQHDDACEAARERKEKLSEVFAREVSKLRERFPRMPLGIWVSSDAEGIILHVSRLTARQAGEALKVLVDRFPVEVEK